MIKYYKFSFFLILRKLYRYTYFFVNFFRIFWKMYLGFSFDQVHEKVTFTTREKKRLDE